MVKSSLVKSSLGKKFLGDGEDILLMAKRDYSDLLLDKTIRRLELAVLGEVNRNRESTVYKKLFPKGLSGIIFALHETEIGMAQILIGTLQETLPQIAQNYIPQLQKAVST